MEIKRGEIYYIDMNPTTGAMEGSLKPALVISNNAQNSYLPTVIVAPISSKRKTVLPTHVDIPSKEGGLAEGSVILLEKISVIDKSRLKRRLGTVSRDTMYQVDYAIRVSLDLP